MDLPLLLIAYLPIAMMLLQAIASGASQSIIGVIIGISSLAVVVLSPLLGYLVRKNFEVKLMQISHALHACMDVTLCRSKCLSACIVI